MSNYRKAGPARVIVSPAVRLWLYGIVGAAVPLLVIYGITTAEQGTAWLAVAGAVLAPAGLGLAAANVPSRRPGAGAGEGEGAGEAGAGEG